MQLWWTQLLTFLFLLSQRATWHVPPSENDIAINGAPATSQVPPTPSTPTNHPRALTPLAQAHPHLANQPHIPSPLASTPATPSLSRSPSPRPGTSSSANSGTERITKDVALKVIPKKKVKGNEEAVWGEMEVLKGLNHPNIVRSYLQLSAEV